MCGLLMAIVANMLMLALVSPSTFVHTYFTSREFLPDQAYVGHVITREFAKEPPDILFLGGSSMRDALPPRGFGEATLAGICKAKLRMFAAATSAQHPTDGWAIVDALRKKPPKMIVVGLTYRRLAMDPAHQPYDLSEQTADLPRSPSAFWDAVSRADLSAGLFDFFSQIRRLTRWKGLLDPTNDRNGMPIRVARDIHDRTTLPGTPIPVSQKQYLAQKMYALWGDHYKRNSKEMAQYWTRFAARMRARGSRVIFVWTPVSEETDALTLTYQAETMAAMATLAATAPTLDLRDHLRGSPNDFRDPLHVTAAGRAKTWPTISRFVAAHGGCTARDISQAGQSPRK
jgi:hypothetical protein